EQVRHADAYARNVQNVLRGRCLPARVELFEVVEELDDLVAEACLSVAHRRPGATVLELERLASASPEHPRFELELVAGLERGKRQRELEAVLGHRFEQTEGAVDGEPIDPVRERFAPIEEPTELELLEQVPEGVRARAAHVGDDADGAQEHRLNLALLVVPDERLRREIR